MVIIGAGFAGASTAWHLSDRGYNNVIILEREDLPGMHASGQNASMIRQFEEDPVMARCTFQGGGFIITPPYNWEKIYDQRGSLILFTKPRIKEIGIAIDFASKMGLECEIVSKKEAAGKIPALDDAEFDQAIWTVTDGIADINRFLWNYLNDAKEGGVQLKRNQRVVEIKKGKGGVFTIITESDIFIANKVVNAAGAWAANVGEMAGASDTKLTPFRRHLYTTNVMERVDPAWPFVWDIDHQYYFRPESGGLLLGPCDEEPSVPGVPSTSHLAREMLADKLGRCCPRLSSVTIATEWAGLRTFAPDRRFVIGEDPNLNNFFWVAGLGGCGVTTSFIVGKFAAEAIVNKGSAVPKEFSPGRFT